VSHKNVFFRLNFFFVFSLSRGNITYFEDLSNDVIYEIFEFLDYFHAYKAFFNLNLRFRNLIINSTLPIQINISSMSRSDFNSYNTDIIKTGRHRINSLRITNPLIYDLVSSPFFILSTFVQLERLFIDKIESNNLQNLVHELISLPLLSSLTITSIDHVENKSTIYCEIFRLPSLKHCKLSLNGWSNNDPLPVAINEYSPIEYLIINHTIYLDELDSLLSYVPQLRRLSLYSLQEPWDKERTKLSSLVLNYLTHVSLTWASINFDQFQHLIIDLFPTIQVLRISISNNTDTTYMDAKRWKQLILSHIPDLRIFDIRLEYSYRNPTTNNNNISELILDAQIDQFTSPFWTERQWFFAQQSYETRYRNHKIIFYSTDLYRYL